MFCSQCGHKNEDENRFCVSCGFELEDNCSQDVDEELPAEDIPGNQTLNSRIKIPKIVVILVSVIAFAAISFLVWHFVVPKFPATIIGHTPVVKDLFGNSMGNILNGGLCDVDGDWIYCNLDGALYKMRLDGKYKIKLADENAVYINVYDGWVYYYDQKYEEYETEKGIYKIRTDGTDKQLLAGIYDCMMVIVMDDLVYYTQCVYNEDEDIVDLYSMELDGTQKKKVISYCYYVQLVDGWIYYYNSSHEIIDYCRRKLDSTDEIVLIGVDYMYESIFPKYDVHAIRVYKEELYMPGYDRGDYDRTPPVHLRVGDLEMKDIREIVYSIKSDSSEWHGIEYASGYYFNIANDFIYYFTDNNLYQAQLDGSQEKKLANNITPGQIYTFDDLLIVVNVNKSDPKLLYTAVKLDGNSFLKLN